MTLLIIDHQDSFTYNLVDAFRVLDCIVRVCASSHLSDQMPVGEYDALVLSPGPGRPSEYPETMSLVKKWPAHKPLLGVCLGMQLLNEWNGGHTIHAPSSVHGKKSAVTHNGRGVFSNLTSPCMVARYHSLACQNVHSDWDIVAETDDHVPMAMQHRTRPWTGLQFHPESFMTTDGRQMLCNWIKRNEL